MRDEPQILPLLAPVWSAFWSLEGSRLSAGGGMGPSVQRPLPYDSIALYLDDHGYHGQERQWMVGLIQHMDGVYLEHQAEQLKALADDVPDPDELTDRHG